MGQIYTKKLRKARNAEITEEKIISSKDSATLFVPTYVPKFGAQGTVSKDRIVPSSPYK